MLRKPGPRELITINNYGHNLVILTLTKSLGHRDSETYHTCPHMLSLSGLECKHRNSCPLSHHYHSLAGGSPAGTKKPDISGCSLTWAEIGV